MPEPLSRKDNNCSNMTFLAVLFLISLILTLAVTMERWKDKVAIVTGASAGIGAAVAESLVCSGLKVVGLARRKERLDELGKKLQGKSGKFYAIKANISKEEDILKAFSWTKENVGPIYILINNAGLGRPATLIEGATSDFKSILDTNVLGLTIATREAVKDMRANNTDGHIIHMNSVVGHYVAHVPNMNIYPASKHAVTALTETLRQELNLIGSKIKVTSVSPGLVDSEIFEVNGYLNDNQTAETLKILPKLQGKDIADAILYVLGTPPHVQLVAYEANLQKRQLQLISTADLRVKGKGINRTKGSLSKRKKPN